MDAVLDDRAAVFAAAIRPDSVFPPGRCAARVRRDLRPHRWWTRQHDAITQSVSLPDRVQVLAGSASRRSCRHDHARDQHPVLDHHPFPPAGAELRLRGGPDGQRPPTGSHRWGPGADPGRGTWPRGADRSHPATGAHITLWAVSLPSRWDWSVSSYFCWSTSFRCTGWW